MKHKRDRTCLQDSRLKLWRKSLRGQAFKGR